ncbi:MULTISPECIES: DUF86 domain-containing protein [Paenibacillus]|uniref:DUF86 domain-containing protein n=1 Tax=Paenibacillus TaxID=44249 RepID=UPI00203C2040|nr:DUF86 domain-containing protein [Paenibacillus camelliae]
MYYVNQEQISIRLAVIPALTDTMNMLQQNWTGSAIERLAQERALHIAIEVVTDVGSYLIDGFLMRDASSYEDIVEITAGEGVYPDGMKEVLLELVRLRRPLVQEYYEWQSDELHPLVKQLPQLLNDFKAAVEQYVASELV